MIRVILFILAILAVSTLGFRVKNKLEDNHLQDHNVDRLQHEFQDCGWDYATSTWHCW